MGVHDPMITWDAKEMPAHKVRITRPFGVGVFLVTDFTGRPDGENPSKCKHPTNPVEMISWYEALKVCNARSLRDGLEIVYELEEYTSTDKWDRYVPKFHMDEIADGWRLPTEAEWEFHCPCIRYGNVARIKCSE